MVDRFNDYFGSLFTVEELDNILKPDKIFSGLETEKLVDIRVDGATVS